jgi:hypothetical protein
MGYFGQSGAHRRVEAEEALNDHYAELESQETSNIYITDTVCCLACGTIQELTWIDGEEIVCALCNGGCEQ